MTHWDRRLANACAVVGVLLLFIAASTYVVEQHATSAFSYSLLAGIALLVAYGILDPTAIADLVRSRQARFGSISLLSTAVVLGGLVALNVFASHGTQAFDLTRGGLNTLAPQSVLAARNLNADLQVIGLFRPGTGNAQSAAEALIGLYEAQSLHVKYRRSNFPTDVVAVNRYAVKQANTIVLDYKGRTELLALGSQTEQDITSAILKLESNHVPLVCWATGDGGRDLRDTNQSSGYSGVADILSKNNFGTRDLLITLTTTIPSDCDEVALTSSKLVLPDSTVKALDDYLANGGKVLIEADPWADPAATRSLSAVIKPYGLAFSGGLVIETDTARAASGDPTVPAVATYGDSPITRDVQGVVSYFPQTTAITGTPDPAATVVAIGMSSNGSYAIDRPRSNLAHQAIDAIGPFTFMETLEKPAGQKRTRIVIVGTGAFAENRALPPNSSDGNLELALGAFQWLAEQDSLISIPPKPSRTLPLALTQQDQSTLIFVTGVLMPGVMVLGGIMVWWRRRSV